MVKIANHLIPAIFESRENRFVGNFLLEGEIHKCHILNPGRMIKFLVPGAKILVEDRRSPKRKIPFSLIYVVHPNSLILIDSIAPNKIVFEALQNKEISEFKNIKLIQSEKIYGINRHSRIDFLLDNRIYIEVKATNYVEKNVGYFPDAPSLRAQKHVKELIDLIEKNPNFEAYIFFIAQRTDINEIRPFDKIDHEFGKILRKGENMGIKLRGFEINFQKNGYNAVLGKEIPINLVKRSNIKKKKRN